MVELDCGPETRYQPTVAMLDALDTPPAGLIVASPANPTGTMIEPAELAALARWCDEHGALLISDEIYHGIEFATPGTPATSTAWSTSRESAVVGSVSKYFSMTGWRLGWILVPQSLQRPLQRLASNMTVCPPSISQYAAIEHSVPRRAPNSTGTSRVTPRTETCCCGDCWRWASRSSPPADGAFYVYADVAHLLRPGETSTAWCSRLLHDTGVALAPGIDFDTVRGGDETVRLSFAGGDRRHRVRPRAPGRLVALVPTARRA